MTSRAFDEPWSNGILHTHFHRTPANEWCILDGRNRWHLPPSEEAIVELRRDAGRTLAGGLLAACVTTLLVANWASLTWLFALVPALPFLVVEAHVRQWPVVDAPYDKWDVFRQRRALRHLIVAITSAAALVLVYTAVQHPGTEYTPLILALAGFTAVAPLVVFAAMQHRANAALAKQSTGA